MQISIPKLCPFQQKNTKLNHPSLIMSRFKNLLLFIFFWRPLNNYLIGVYLNNLIFFSCNPHYSIGLQWLYLPTNQTARNKRWLSTNRQEIFQPNRNSAWSCSVFAGVFFPEHRHHEDHVHKQTPAWFPAGSFVPVVLLHTSITDTSRSCLSICFSHVKHEAVFFPVSDLN